MKKINLLFIFFAIFSFNSSLLAQTLNFHKGTIKEAMALGKQQNKMVFIDFFTDWCAPCKMMDRDVFTDPEIVKYFNKHFISVKLDAEKGEGINFARKNKVNAYPTFIIFNSDETPELKLVGAYNAKIFLEKVQKGMDTKRSPEALEKRYKDGERTPVLVNDYAFSIMEKGMEKEGFEVVNNYFKSLSKKQLRNPSNWFLFERYTPNVKDEKAQFLFINKKFIAQKIGEEKVNKIINGLLHSEMLTYLSGYKIRTNTFQQEDYSTLKNTIIDAQLPASFGYNSALSILDAQINKDFKKYLSECESNFQSLQKSARFVIMMNMESNLKDADDKIKLRAADFLEKNVTELKDKIASKSIQKTILNFRNEEEYTSVNFEKGNFNGILNKAKAQDKLIFFDAYASWCGPCKVMDETVFSDPVAGKFFNSNFVNAKVDMEKGEGPDLLKSYPVSAFPTYLLIDNNGKEVHRIVGSYETAEFINLVRKGSEPQSGLTYLKEAYKNSSREAAMMKSLTEGLSYSYQKGELNKILNNYFEEQTKEERMDKKNLFIYQYSSGILDKKFQYFIENAGQLKQHLGESAFFATVDQVAVPNLMNEQVNFKKKDFIKTKYPQLYTLNLPAESVTKILMGVFEIAGDGNLDKLIEYQEKNVLKLPNERDRLMTLYLLLSIPNSGTDAQKLKLQSLLKNVIANTKKEMIKDSLEMFLKNLEAKIPVGAKPASS